MFVLQSRYEYWSNYEGKKWTKWFNVHGGKFETIEEANQELEITKKKSDGADKSTKLRHEFQIVKI